MHKLYTPNRREQTERSVGRQKRHTHAIYCPIAGTNNTETRYENQRIASHNKFGRRQTAHSATARISDVCMCSAASIASSCRAVRTGRTIDKKIPGSIAPRRKHGTLRAKGEEFIFAHSRATNMEQTVCLAKNLCSIM